MYTSLRVTYDSVYKYTFNLTVSRTMFSKSIKKGTLTYNYEILPFVLVPYVSMIII